MMEDKVILTVIVPVYNNELYLYDTLHSLEIQSFKDFEVIIINDGSTDKSEIIIDQFAEKDKRFKKINQYNQGVSAARNKGLDIAKGTYITFADGDDTLPQNALQEMYNVARNYKPDLIIGGNQRIDGTIAKVNQRTKKLRNKRKISCDDLDLVHGLSLWNKWFLKSIIDKYKVRFESFRHLEDGVFLYTYLQYIENINYCDSIVYNYYKRIPTNAGSVTQKLSTGLLENAIGAYERIEELTQNYSEEFKQELAYRINSTTFIGDYYKKIWILDQDTENLLVDYVKKTWRKQSPKQQENTIIQHKGLELEKGIRTKIELLEDIIFTIYISANIEANNINVILRSLYGQSVPGFKVILDEKYRKHVDEFFVKMYNLEFQNVGKCSKDYEKLLDKNNKLRYFMILDQDIIFDYDTLSKAYEILNKSNCALLKMDNTSLESYLSGSIFNFECYQNNETGFDSNNNLHTQKDALPIIIESAESKGCEQEADIKNSLIEKIKRGIDWRKRKLKKKIQKIEKNENEPQKLKPKKKVYLDYYFECEINDKVILFDGLERKVTDSLILIINESKKQNDKLIYITIDADAINKTEQVLKENDFENVRYVVFDSNDYKEILCTAKYLFSEVQFPSYWVKKKEQIYVENISFEELYTKENEIVESQNKEKQILVYSDGWHPCEATDKIIQLYGRNKLCGRICFSYKALCAQNYTSYNSILLDNSNTIEIKGDQLFTIEQRIQRISYRSAQIGFEEALNSLESAYKTEIIRCFKEQEFDRVILYDTVDSEKIIAFTYFECERYLFLQSDLIRLLINGNQYLIDAVKHFQNNGGILMADSLAVEEVRVLLDTTSILEISIEEII